MITIAKKAAQYTDEDNDNGSAAGEKARTDQLGRDMGFYSARMSRKMTNRLCPPSVLRSWISLSVSCSSHTNDSVHALHVVSSTTTRFRQILRKPPDCELS